MESTNRPHKRARKNQLPNRHLSVFELGNGGRLPPGSFQPYFCHSRCLGAILRRFALSHLEPPRHPLLFTTLLGLLFAQMAGIAMLASVASVASSLPVSNEPVLSESKGDDPPPDAVSSSTLRPKTRSPLDSLKGDIEKLVSMLPWFFFLVRHDVLTHTGVRRYASCSAPQKELRRPHVWLLYIRSGWERRFCGVPSLAEVVRQPPALRPRSADCHGGTFA